MLSQTLIRHILNRFGWYNPSVRISDAISGLLRKNGVNICYNKYVRAQYKPECQNILLALESPAMIDHYQWLDDGMQFAAEISFKNYYNLGNYRCCRTLYVNNDNFVGMDDVQGHRKDRMVSMIYSTLDFLPGHKLRYSVADRFGEQIDLFGSGTGRFLREKKESLVPYFFQIVIENGKYPEYVSEKLFDCIKTHTIPVYWGGESALKKMGFDVDAMVFFNSIEELHAILEDKINTDHYHKVIEGVQYNRQRLVELRNEARMDLYYHAYYHRYIHTPESYHGHKKSKYNHRMQ